MTNRCFNHRRPCSYVHIMEQYRPQHLVGVGEQRSRGFTK